MWALMAVMTLVVTAFVLTLASPGRASAAGTNLLQGKEVTASAQYDTMPASNLVDGKDDTRWLGSEQTVGSFRVLWESAENYASAYNVYVSNSTDAWGDPVYSTTGNSAQENEVTLESPATGRYIKLEVTDQHGYPSVSAFEFQAFVPESIELVNLAQGKNVTASSQEADTVRPELAVDGNTTDRDSRWGSNLNDKPAWITVDLGKSSTISSVEIYWERCTATSYKVQYSNAETDPGASGEWTDVASFTEAPVDTHQVVTLAEPTEARFVRLYIEDYLADDSTTDEDVEWNTISIYELLVMGEGDGTEPEQDPQENVARGKTAAADSSEAGTLGADKAVDGDTTSKSSRWASADLC